MKPYYVAAVVGGLLCGFVTIHSAFEHSWTSIIFWVACGLLLVAFAPNRMQGHHGGALFGFFTIASWLASGFQGASSALPGFIVLTLVLSTLGGACGAIGALIFSRLFKAR